MMSGRYKAYAEYKDSGVEWLGEVPEHWAVKRISYIATLKSGDAIVSEEIEKDGNFPVYGGNGLRGYSENFNHDGDYILIGRQGALCGNINYGFGKFWASEHAMVVHPTLWLNYKWLGETLRAMNLNQYNFSAAQPGLAITNITCLKIPLPTVEEQEKIANFLDHETAKIDALIDKQQQLIKLLKEKRQAVISHAVTKGLNPAAPMRDSGVEWLGEVPEHWEVSYLKRLVSKIGSGKTPLGGSEVYVDDGILFLRSQNVYDDGLRLEDAVFIAPEVDRSMINTRVQPGDILLNVTGASIGRTCLVPKMFVPANVNQHVCIIRVSVKEQRNFIALVMKSDLIKSQVSVAQTGAAREGLNFDQLGNFVFVLPSIEEQIAIATFLDRKTTKLDTLTAKAQSVIDLLKERRTALISAAVTGKIDVRNWQAPASFRNPKEAFA